MKKILYILFGLCLWTISCTKDHGGSGRGGKDEGIISLNATATRAIGNNSAIIYLTAFTEDGQTVYIPETPVYSPAGLDENISPLTFPGGSPYYPLANQEISFFAYTGKADNGFMKLRAGNTELDDYVLSNYGLRSSQTVLDPDGEGLGTPGSSGDPAHVLQFRHVMTQLIVEIEIDENEDPQVYPVPTDIEFTIEGLAAEGLYSIRALSPDPNDEQNADKAVSSSGEYTAKLGENFVIPNGTSLDGKRFTSLKIDKYEATAEDLQGFVITANPDNESDLLLPGYSYKLTMTIGRLGLVGVRLSRVLWSTQELTNNKPSYDPYNLSLALGLLYQNSGEDAITKVVLYTSDGKQYVGDISEQNAPALDFVVLPKSGVNRVDLMTDKGLLLTAPVSTGYMVDAAGNATLTMNISRGGMLAVNPGVANSPTNPYLITTPVQFLNVEKELGAYYRQAIDIDLDSVITADGDTGFTGFGTFSGEYDGAGYWIANIEMNSPGLFAVNNGILKNIRIFSGIFDATGLSYAGSICGVNNNTIVACINEAMIYNSTTTAGGICGQNNTPGIIVACLNTGNIPTAQVAGGIVGENNNTAERTIAACINTGMVAPKATLLGGIIGTSQATTNNVVRTSFWLVGTAAPGIGQREFAVGSDNTELFDTTYLDPDRMRNKLNAGEDPSQATMSKLESELAYFPQWNTEYVFSLNGAVTGITWPAPIKVN